MPKQGKQKIWESFEGRKATVLVGFLCFSYFMLNLFTDSKGMIANILPPLPPLVILILACGGFIYQVVIWRVLGFFKEPWYRHTSIWFLFACEFNLILFVLIFLTWPLYLLYVFLVNLPAA